MTTLFYISAAVAIFSTFMAITRLNAIHALLYLIVSLFSVALIFFLLGAPFAGVLELIIYAGAIVVLFVFVVMMLSIGPESEEAERQLFPPGIWIGPAILAAVLALQLAYVVMRGGLAATQPQMIGPKEVGAALFGPYLIAVEVASILLLAGLVGAYHLGRKTMKEENK